MHGKRKLYPGSRLDMVVRHVGENPCPFPGQGTGRSLNPIAAGNARGALTLEGTGDENYISFVRYKKYPAEKSSQRASIPSAAHLDHHKLVKDHLWKSAGSTRSAGQCVVDVVSRPPSIFHLRRGVFGSEACTEDPTMPCSFVAGTNSGAARMLRRYENQ